MKVKRGHKRFKLTKAANAMASRNGTSESRDVEVNAAASESASSPSPQLELGRDDAPKLDLFVGNLSLYTEAASLKEYFE